VVTDTSLTLLTNVIKVGEWTGIFLGDVATDLLIFYLAAARVWPLQMKTGLKIKALSGYSARTLL
jgi:hypothetical protein